MYRDKLNVSLCICCFCGKLFSCAITAHFRKSKTISSLCRPFPAVKQHSILLCSSHIHVLQFQNVVCRVESVKTLYAQSKTPDGSGSLQVVQYWDSDYNYLLWYDDKSRGDQWIEAMVDLPNNVTEEDSYTIQFRSFVGSSAYGKSNELVEESLPSSLYLGLTYSGNNSQLCLTQCLRTYATFVEFIVKIDLSIVLSTF